jgi:DNA-binding beta-propeller fold protein YncE
MSASILLGALLLAAGETLTPLPLPGGEGGIGFDDLRYSSELRKLLVPAGRSGRLDLLDPKTRAIVEIKGFSSSREGGRGHSQGTTSADEGEGLIFASDRSEQTLVVIEAASLRIVARVKLGGSPDYVRWVAPMREVWVSEPGSKAIETFRLAGKSPPKLDPAGNIEVQDGPESLEIDPPRHRAYANTWHDTTVGIDLGSRAIAARWRNGCEGARGLAVDPARGFAFVGCTEGKAVVLDVAHDGKMLGTAKTGDGVDIIAFSAKLSHLYVPGGKAANMTVLGVADGGDLKLLGTVATSADAHCVAADDDENAWVCDPGKGRLLLFHDSYR